MSATEVTFKIKHNENHSSSHTYKHTALHCPGCGAKTVWRDTGGGDLYLGATHICISCKGVFCMPDAVFTGKMDDAEYQTYNAIRSHIRNSHNG